MYITDKVFLHMVKSAGISVHAGLIDSNNIIHYNQRHASIDHLPEKFKSLPRYGVIRKPEDWYRSFFKFFYKVEGYMSFMISDPKEPNEKGEIYIEPIPFNEFVKRSINFKDTLLKYPNKARVFNNILRSQGNIHFINGYFKEAIGITKKNVFLDVSTLEQFDMSLYEWFYRGCGMHTSTNIPMNKLDDIEELFNIKIGHENKTNEVKIDTTYEPEVLELLRKTHKKFYDEIADYKGIK